MLIGDFNDITENSDKRRGSSRTERRCRIFKRHIRDCGLIDFHFVGPKFTWWNSRGLFVSGSVLIGPLQPPIGAKNCPRLEFFIFQESIMIMLKFGCLPIQISLG